jgi:hypothetical protein
MAASSTSRFCLVSKEDIERLIDNAIPDKIFTKTIRLRARDFYEVIVNSSKTPC